MRSKQDFSNCRRFSKAVSGVVAAFLFCAVAGTVVTLALSMPNAGAKRVDRRLSQLNGQPSGVPLRIEKTPADLIPSLDGHEAKVHEFPTLPKYHPRRRPQVDDSRVRATPLAQAVASRMLERFQINGEDVLKERDGIFAYSSRAYAMTLDRGFITVENPALLDDLGHPALAYRMSEVRVGEKLIASGDQTSPEARPNDRTVSYKHGPVEERYRLGKDNLEQDIIVRELPGSRGATTVSGTISTNLTPPADGTTGASLSFMHEGREVLSFSKAVAIDGSGRTLPLEMAYASGSVSMTIPASWVSEASLPITIDPVIGSPITIDSSLQSANYQVSDISFNTAHNTWLVIWNEWAGSSFGNNVYGQLIDAAGNLVGNRLSIGAAAADEWGGTVSYAPAPIDRWLVTWVYIPRLAGSNGSQIQGAVLNGDGTFYKPSFLVDKRANANFYPTVAYDGMKWHVNWTNLLITSTATPATIVGRFVSTAGVPGVAADVQTTAALGQFTNSVSFANGRYTFLWKSGMGARTELLARTMDPVGTLSPIVTVGSTGGSNGTGHVTPGPSGKLLLVWPVGSSIQARLADANLNFHSGPFSIAGGEECSAAYSATSEKWFVVAGGRNLYGALVDASGAVSPPEFLAPGSSVSGTFAPRVAWNSAVNEMLAIYNIFPAAGSIQNLKAVRYAMPAAPPPGGLPDNTPPSVSITAPSNGATVSGTVVVKANATDNIGVVKVEFLAGGAVFGVDTSSPYTASWNSTTAANGAISLAAKAYDAAGNSATASISITVSNQNLQPPQTPSINSITPSRAGPCARMKIEGDHLVSPGSTTKVIFTPSVEGIIETQSVKEIVVRVPITAESGLLFVQVGPARSNGVNFELVLSYTTPPDSSAIVRDSSGGALTTLTDLLVTLSDFLAFDDAARVATKFNGRVVGYLAASNTYLMRFPAGTPEQLHTLSKNLDVEPGVAQSMLRIALQPTQAKDSIDKRYEDDRTNGRTGIWGWDRVQAVGAWRMLAGVGLNDMKVAVFDTGVLRTHIDFSGVRLTQIESTGGNLTEVAYSGTDVNPQGHGTGVASIIGAAANGIGIDGVLAPPLANRHTLQIHQSAGQHVDAFYDDVMKSIEAADRTGARVFNLCQEMSLEFMLAELPDAWKSPQGPRTWAGDISIHLTRLLNDFRTQIKRHSNVLLVVAAGNHNLNIDTNPRLFGSANARGLNENVMVVGGISLDDNRWRSTNEFGSNYGSIDIAAPAHRILLPTLDTNPDKMHTEDPANPANSQYALESGTSFATPFVSGAAALLFAIDGAIDGNLTPRDVKNLLVDNAFSVLVDTPAGKQTFRTLKIADTVGALLTRLRRPQQSWSRLYAVSTSHGNLGGGIVRFPMVTRSAASPDDTYVAQGAAEPVYASYAEFSSASNGNSLAAAEVDNNLGGIDERIKQVSLPGGAAATTVACGGFPALFPSKAMAFVTDQCMNNTPQDLYLRLRNGMAVVPMTRIAGPTAVAASFDQASNTWTANPLGAVPIPFRNFFFGAVSGTPDNRWIAFTERSGGNMYLFPSFGLENPNLKPFDAVRRMANANQFLTVSQGATPLANVLIPAISPDGSRIAFMDKNTRELRIARLDVVDNVNDKGPVTVNTWQYSEVLNLGEQLPFGIMPYLTWSPDGSQIIFSRGADIYVISGAAGDYTNGATRKSAKMVGAALTSTPTFAWAWRE